MIKKPRCKVCGSLDNVREDGICGGCYDLRCATAAGTSYGKWVAQHGNGFRRGKTSEAKLCQVCGMVIPKTSRSVKYCSAVCSRRARYYRDAVTAPQVKKRNTCRGCRYHVPGSLRCVNTKAKIYGQRYNGSCDLYERMGGDG